MNLLLKRTIRSIAVFAALTSIVAMAEESVSTGKKGSAPPDQAYLGVVVTSAHPVLSSNLNGLLKAEQGLTADAIAANSPAMKAGVKVHDVLTSYDDQKLFSPEQLAKLVQADKPGRKVDLEVLRGGKLEHLSVVLDKRDVTDFRAWSAPLRSQPYRFGPPEHILRRFQGHPSPAAEWENFQSLTIKRIASDKLHVELQHLEQDGSVHKLEFEGSREQIQKEIAAAKDMKPVERGHLLRALNLYDPGNASPFPHIWYEPEVGWRFEQPGGPFH